MSHAPENQTQVAALELLCAGRDRLTLGWCQHAFAKDAAGYTCRVSSEQARSWCLLGAIHPTFSDDLETYLQALNWLTHGVKRFGPLLNDSDDFDQHKALDIYSQAIDYASQQLFPVKPSMEAV